ncbi:Hypothetical protein PBC10988_2530 [Planctomycetales bacterium 10988]|nr:Hypothetical protein PBC10988_2530 [Planctomycetales bacterium 10988]
MGVCLLVAGWSLWQVILPSGQGMTENSFASQTVPSETESTQPDFIRTPIVDVQVGERVLGRNPEVSEAERAAFIDPDPATWRKLQLQLPKESGHVLDITLLRPLIWIEHHQATVNGFVHLDMAELGAKGNAKVLSIEPCPEIDPPPGNVVTGKFVHGTDQAAIDVNVEGQTEPIGCTVTHPFWSETRQAFIAAGQLQPGETVLTRDGSNVKGIRGNWFGGGDLSSNYDAFRRAVQSGVPENEAAFRTFTGHMARKHGFTKVRIVEDSARTIVVEFY